MKTLDKAGGAFHIYAVANERNVSNGNTEGTGDSAVGYFLAAA